MRAIGLYYAGRSVLLEELARILGAATPGMTYRAYGELSTEGLRDLGVAGFQVDDFVRTITAQLPPEADHVRVVLTGIQFEYAWRVVIRDDSSLAIISAPALIQGGALRALCALVYASLLCVSRLCPRPQDHGSHDCIVAFRRHHTDIQPNFCEQCRSTLREHRHSAERALERILSGSTKGPVVILEHGFRTHAHWFEPLQLELEKHGMIVGTARYGHFSAVKLLFHHYFGKSTVMQFVERYRSLRASYPTLPLCVIAHSYGTMVLARALDANPDIRIDDVVLVASILPRDYDWPSKIEAARVSRVLNQCGRLDFWPICAEHVVPGAGASGALFFFQGGDRIFNQRIDGASHSALLTKENCDATWVPFLCDVNWRPQSTSLRPPWLFLQLHKRSVFWTLFLLLLALGGWTARHVTKWLGTMWW